MDDVLDETFYNDDFLTRTLTSSAIYDKSNLDLTFVDNNNLPNKHNDDGDDTDSPNLDFLKLGSPDLEQMFMDINDTNDRVSNDDENSVTHAAFSIEEDLVNADNCFTEALQQLHDKQEHIPFDAIKTKMEDVKPVIEKKNKSNQLQVISSSLPSPSKQRSKNHSRRHNQNKHVYNNNNAHVQTKNLHRDLNTLQSHHHLQQSQNVSQSHLSIPEQMALTNQMALMNSMNPGLNVHQLQQQQQQQQQEIAFLTQAMGYQSDRENMQAHLLNSGYPGPNNQVLPHIQQKLLEQQLLHQQLNNGYHGNENPTMSSMAQIDSLEDLGIDEQTIKMFVDNPHLAPINLEIQELIKRERKKLRNRIASSKCRKRKLEREGRLEDKVRNLKEKNIELNAVANALKQQICDLKQRVMDHVSEGCQIVLPS